MRISNLRLGIYVAAILFALFAALPNILPDAQLARLPGFLPNERVTLGLDLRGGSHLVLEVDGAGLVRERLTQLNTDIREELRKANIGVQAMERQGNGISVTLANAADRGRAQAALRTLAMPAALGGAADLDIAATAPEKISVTLSDAGMRDRINAVEDQLTPDIIA